MWQLWTDKVEISRQKKANDVSLVNCCSNSKERTESSVAAAGGVGMME